MQTCPYFSSAELRLRNHGLRERVEISFLQFCEEKKEREKKLSLFMATHAIAKVKHTQAEGNPIKLILSLKVYSLRECITLI